MPKITTFLWFNNQAEEAARFYTSIFPNSKITAISRYTEAGPAPAGTVMTVNFSLDGQEYTALNGGPEFKFTPAISLYVHCKNQEEVDRYWEALLQGGQAVQCGWLTDKYGLSWQIVPDRLTELLQDKDPKAVKRVTEAMLKMIKLDIRELECAAENVPCKS
ncbi:MAG: VOC family protein [Anaerolineae bacterium]